MFFCCCNPPCTWVVKATGCNNAALPGAAVTVKQSGVTFATGTTDAGGLFTFSAASTLTLTADVSATGFTARTGVALTHCATTTIHLTRLTTQSCGCGDGCDTNPGSITLTDANGAWTAGYNAGFGGWLVCCSATKTCVTCYNDPVNGWQYKTQSMTVVYGYEVTCVLNTQTPAYLPTSQTMNVLVRWPNLDCNGSPSTHFYLGDASCSTSAFGVAITLSSTLCSSSSGAILGCSGNVVAKNSQTASGNVSRTLCQPYNFTATLTPGSGYSPPGGVSVVVSP